MQCLLSCVIVVALKGMFMKLVDIPALWRVSRIDAVSRAKDYSYQRTRFPSVLTIQVKEVNVQKCSERVKE